MATPHNGVNAPFYSVNRGKKSLAIDLKSKEGKEILLKLAEDADVFMQNFRPGAIDRMGFSEKVIRKLNKKLFTYQLVVWEKGPYSQSRVYDPVIQVYQSNRYSSYRDTGRPKMFRIIIADKTTALTAAQAVSSLFMLERYQVLGSILIYHVREYACLLA